MDSQLLRRTVFESFDRLDPSDRISLAEDLYTAELSGESVLDPGKMALRLNDIAVGEHFICMPAPEDGKGNGGLKNGYFIFKKIKTSRSGHKLDPDEYRNVLGLKAERLYTMHPQTWVLKIIL